LTPFQVVDDGLRLKESRNTVTNYLEKYQTGGLEDLVSNDYQGSECRLSEVQQRKLTQLFPFIFLKND
jgi:hypothetical protein